jgi:hypothetical protein
VIQRCQKRLQRTLLLSKGTQIEEGLCASYNNISRLNRC